jgi:hypothetical protein
LITQKEEEVKTDEKFLCSKIAIYLCPSYRRRLQPSKRTSSFFVAVGILILATSPQEELTWLHEGPPPPGNSFVVVEEDIHVNDGFLYIKNFNCNFLKLFSKSKTLILIRIQQNTYLDPDSMNPAAKHCLHAR